MLLPFTTIYVFVGIAAIGFVFAARLRMRPPRRRALYAVGPSLMLIGLLGGCAVYVFGTETIVVTYDGYVTAGTKYVLLGSRTFGEHAIGHQPRPSTNIVNDTDVPMRVIESVYGVSVEPVAAPIEIPPHSVAVAGEVDYVGPDNPPPVSIESSSSHVVTRWLTW